MKFDEEMLRIAIEGAEGTSGAAMVLRELANLFRSRGRPASYETTLERLAADCECAMSDEDEDELEGLREFGTKLTAVVEDYMEGTVDDAVLGCTEGGADIADIIDHASLFVLVPEDKRIPAKDKAETITNRIVGAIGQALDERDDRDAILRMLASRFDLHVLSDDDVHRLHEIRTLLTDMMPKDAAT
jgi:hypothetical protein